MFWQLLASPRTERTGDPPRAATLLHPRALSPQAGAPTCINGGNIVTDNGNLIKVVDTDNSLTLLPTCDGTTVDRLCLEFWIWTGSLALCGVILSVGTLHTARKSLKHGEEAARIVETMTYEERLLAVSTLSLVRALMLLLTA